MSKTLWESLLNTVSKHGKRPMFHTNETSAISYDNFMNTVNGYKYLMHRNGIKKGDKIVILGENSSNWAAVSYATYGMGATVVSIFRAQQNEIKKHVIEQTSPKLIFNSTPVSVSSLFEPTKVKFKEINHETFQPDSIKTMIDVDTEPNSLAMILYTSGTSGMPKGVPLTHTNVMSNLNAISNATTNSNDIISEYDKYVSFLPWNHCYGLNCEFNYMVSKGGSMYINKNINKLRSDIRIHNPTILCTVPRLFQLMHDKISFVNHFPKFAKGIAKTILFGKNIRYATVGGASISPELLHFYDKLGLRVYQGYGSTECSPMISLNNTDNNRVGSVGKALDCNEVSIKNDNDLELFNWMNSIKLNEYKTGEILVKGSNVMSGYYNYDPMESFEMVNGEKFYKTGDVGYIDKDGFLFITGRIKEQYKLSNGEFVNPIEVENILLQIPEIKQVVVCGKDKDYNTAIIVTDKSKHFIESKIKQIEHKMKKYEIPKKIICVEGPFTVENGFLTQKQSLRRNEIIDYYIN